MMLRRLVIRIILLIYSQIQSKNNR
jgi:hypothetical protein